ncbi:MAG: hypothetical protein IJ958_03765, partial [Agathobacter sp.]|nr:hypothetical protein [Agathobacter sp.]
MRKRIGALILVITMVLTMLPTTVFATESQMSEEFASILNENGDLEITWSCHEEGMKEILSEWVTNNKSDDVYGSFRVDAYDELTDKVTLTFIGTNGEEESHEVDLIINEQFSDTFQAILTDGQIVLPTTCNNISIEWINSYLYDFDNTYAFWIGHYTDDAGETISLIDEGCTSATIKMYGKNSSDVEYHKVELSRMTEMSEEFRDYLNSDGKVYMNAAPPQDEWDFYDLFSLLIGEDGVGFYNLSQDFKTIDFCVGYEMHTVEIEYDYDPAIQAKIRPYMEELPLDKLFAVRDLELINYWVNNVGNEDEDTLDAYSGELKECIGYNNITYYVDNRMGMDEPFYTERFGIALFLYKDAVYYANSMLGTCAEHVIYVPDETANTSNALKEAAQKRIDEYIGVGKVELQDAGTVKDVLKVFYPDALDDELQDYICVEDVTGDEPAYKLVVSGESGAEKSYYIVVKRDSTKRLTPSYEVADLETEIIINSISSEIPLDTKIQSEKLTSGTEYEKIVDLLDVETNETYDINLYSDSIQDNITKLENGTFEVQIPISNELKDKELVAYYVDENNQIIEYEVEVTDDGNASFSTNHFSIYTIAPVDEIEEEPDDPVDPEEPDEPEYDIVEPEDND